MATLDISGALQAMVSANTPAAMMERNMALAMFSNRVNEVVDSSISKLLEDGREVQKLEAAGEITPEIAQLVIEARKQQLANHQRFSAGYFS